MPFTVTLTRRRRNNFVRNYSFPRAQVKIEFAQGSLRKDIFKRRTPTGSNAFPRIIELETTKYVLLSVSTLTKAILGKTTLQSNPKFSFELTCVAQKRLYLKGFCQGSPVILFNFANFSPSIAMEIKVSKEITGI